MRNHPLTNRRRQRTRYHWNRLKEKCMKRVAKHVSKADRIHGITCKGSLIDELPPVDRNVMTYTTPMRSDIDNPVLRAFREASEVLRKNKIPRDVMLYCVDEDE